MTWQTWVIILAWAVTQSFVGVAICEVFDIKYTKKSIVALYAAGMVLAKIAWAGLFIFLPILPWHHIFLGGLLPAYTFIFIWLTCRDEIKNIIFVITLIFSIVLLSHLLKSFIVSLIFYEGIVFDFAGTQPMFSSLLGAGMVVLSLKTFVVVWRRNVGNAIPQIPNIWTFILILSGQLAFSMNQYLTLLTHGLSGFNPLATFGVLIMLIGNIAILQIILTNSKKAEMDRQLQETRHKMELEQSHYKQVEQRRAELTKIRHDFNNQLATIERLMKSGNESSAQEMVSALSKKIQQTNENPYCNIPVINAILSEKAQACEIAGIGLAVELDIPTKLIVEQIHLCSIFGNLLDNAIAACIQIKDNETVTPGTETARMPTIQLNSTIHGDYLFIKAINPSSEPPKKPPFGRGHGTHILSDITARYDGDYRTKYKDGVFTAVVSLLAVGEG